ncbi:MAG: type II toxin-antitoxin system VapB family antitoxin [Magnetococcales bacterium]|nr:type II toxin-antitoxin system VapB family antitoxin [Magnetococcales bacterium]
MMTTIEINDALMLTAQKLAHQRNLTLRQVVESALQSFVEQEQEREKGFRLRKCSFRGNGLQTDIQEGDWAAIRERIDGDREKMIHVENPLRGVTK